jgi:hypothetical protein
VSALSDILAQPIGAQFFRADLYTHSYGASHDVKDASMTSAAIVQTAAREGLSIVAITDHNEISNVEPALEAAHGSNVLVIPGVELISSSGWVPSAQPQALVEGRATRATSSHMSAHCRGSQRVGPSRECTIWAS